MKTLLETILSRELHDPKVVIYKWLDEHGIKNYTINDKGEVDVDGRVVLTNNHLSEFPKYIQFNIVKRDFYCSHNELVSLRGCPREVGGKFDCSYNKLTTLEGSPEKVGGDFDCHNNNLRDLKGAPLKMKSFDCNYNELTSLEGAPVKVEGSFFCNNNVLTTLKGAPREVGGGFYCQRNNLKDLKGAPEKVGGWFHCENNKLISLEGAPKEAKYFDCENNTTKFTEENVRKVCKVEKNIYV